MTWVSAEHCGPYGKISSKWKTEKGEFHLEVEIPPESTAMVIMPGSSRREVGSGKHGFTASINGKF